MFIPLTADGHLCCFCFLAMMNNDAWDIGVYDLHM